MTETAKHDGGPAFPRTGGEVPGPNTTEWVAPQSGMSLRDWFAAMAPKPPKWRMELAHKLDRSRNPHNDSYKPPIRSAFEVEADLRYEFADAMLRARAEGKAGA